MAKEKGFYAQRGLDVEILSGGGDNPPYPSLIEGSADISNLNLITALKYHVTDHQLVCLAQISQKSSTVLVGKKTSGIKTIKDLEGKKIGVWRDGGGRSRSFLSGKPGHEHPRDPDRLVGEPLAQ
ncbi:MAG: ABC transporter substrate-binding protein [Candidatus Cloacimonetes bacterium]|nr:ABC transporter substrate-binding protein [Candidatus Cloacimonadota bacterium]